jgi:hypothetical protein
MRSKPEALCIVSGIRLSPIISASVSGSIGGYYRPDQTRFRLRYLEMCSIAALTEKHEVRTQVNENYRNSKTGKFVTKEYVEEHPKKTETEHNPRRTPPSKTTKKR